MDRRFKNISSANKIRQLNTEIKWIEDEIVRIAQRYSLKMSEYNSIKNTLSKLKQTFKEKELSMLQTKKNITITRLMTKRNEILKIKARYENNINTSRNNSIHRISNSIENNNTRTKNSIHTISNIMNTFKHNEKTQLEKKLVKTTIKFIPIVGKKLVGVASIFKLCKSRKINLENNLLNEILLFLYLQTRANFIALNELIQTISTQNQKINNYNLYQNEYKNYQKMFNSSNGLQRQLSSKSKTLKKSFEKEKRDNLKFSSIKNISKNLLNVGNETGVLSSSMEAIYLVKELKNITSIENTMLFRTLKQCLENKEKLDELVYIHLGKNSNINALTKERSKTSSAIINSYTQNYKNKISSEIFTEITKLIPGSSMLKMTANFKKNLDDYIQEIEKINNLDDTTLKSLLLNRFICKHIKNIFDSNYECIGNNKTNNMNNQNQRVNNQNQRVNNQNQMVNNQNQRVNNQNQRVNNQNQRVNNQNQRVNNQNQRVNNQSPNVRKISINTKNGKNIIVDITNINTISQLKNKIQTQEEILKKYQNLVIGGKSLNGNKLLSNIIKEFRINTSTIPKAKITLIILENKDREGTNLNPLYGKINNF